MANAPERVEMPLEGMNSQIPNPRKRGRDPKILVQAKRRRMQRQNTMEHALYSNSVVPEEIHPEDEGPIAQTRTNESTGASEQPDLSVLGNQEELDKLNEIATNYASTGELFNRKTTTVDIHFGSKIADAIDEDIEPKSMAECWKH
jgi:hypothetical protein